VAADPFVVVQKIAAAVEHQLVPVHVDGPWMVRRMSMNDVDAAIDEPVCETDLCRRHLVAPVAAPVNGHHPDIARPPQAQESIRKRVGGPIRETVQEIDPWSVRGRRPDRRNAARLGPQRPHEQTAALAIHNGRLAGLYERGSGTGDFQSGALECLQRFRKAFIPIVEHVVVCERTNTNVRCGQAGDVIRVHSVVDTLALPVVVAARDAGFQIDHAGIRRCPVELVERITPDV
jgi:hypothetical protein